jgi:hypothetical protein
VNRATLRYEHHRDPQAAISSDGNDGDKAALENAARFPHSHRTTTNETMNRKETYSALLLETVT